MTPRTSASPDSAAPSDAVLRITKPGAGQFWAAFCRNPAAVAGLVVISLVVILALASSALYPDGALRLYPERNVWPFQSAAHLLGTDNLGRDIIAAVLHGTRVSLTVALMAALGAVLLGVSVGSVAGYYGGSVDNFMMRFSELFQVLPNLLFALVLGTILGPSITTIVLALSLVTWPSMARMVRAEFMALREREYVLACKGIGMPDWQIMLRQILPNALPSIIVLASLQMAVAMLVESALAFLGLSDPSRPSLGWLIGKGREVLRTEWYVALIPGLMIILIVVSINLTAEGLNDALNPRARRRT